MISHFSCRNSNRLQMGLLLFGLLLLFHCGCSDPPEFRFNAVRLRTLEKIELEKGKHYDEVHQRDIGNLLTAMFGTPDDPHFPNLGEDFESLVDLEKLRMAAGPVKSDRAGVPQGLYREHCASCHGISGDGYGPSAAILNPYPRDFRLGKFKFKQTSVGTPPATGDLHQIIRNGIPGTAMPSFRTLEEKEVEALVDYVKYLSIRGQVERNLIKLLADLEDGERLIDLGEPKASSDDSADSTDPDEKRVEQLGLIIDEVLFDLFDSWLNAEEAALDIPSAPESFRLGHEGRPALIQQGRELFFGKANCVQCHGNTGLGDGGQVNYDDWTTDWSKDTGVNLQDPKTYEDFSKLGLLKPRQLRPRNLRMGVFRGGNRPKDLFHRVSEGIEGTPMPATLTLSAEEKWALVAYVMNLPYEKNSSQPAGSNQ